MTGKEPEVVAPIITNCDRIFKLSGEPLYGGKGKHSYLNSKECDTVSDVPCIEEASDGDPDAQGNEQRPPTGNAFKGLRQPRLQGTQAVVCGENKTIMRKENKRRRQELRAEQPLVSPWSYYEGKTPTECPTNHSARPTYWNSMCPMGRALQHPAATVLEEWAQFGCLMRTGKPWTKEEMWEAVARGPHRLALSPEAISHFKEEAAEKVRTNQARLVRWDDIKDNPPKELKISPIAAIPHRSKHFRSILDLSFRLRLKNGGVLASVNDTTKKTAPAGAINQIGDCLSRIIHSFAEADDDAKIFMAKWDIKTASGGWIAPWGRNEILHTFSHRRRECQPLLSY